MDPTTSEMAPRSRFKPNAIEINNAEPFGSDRLSRKNEIENLTTLLANSEAPLVLAVDAPWGSGKTTFMKIWRAYLSKECPSFASAYFSAWETDLSEDPLNVFLGEINEQLACKARGMTLFKWKKAISLAGKITKSTLPALAKIATYGALDLQGKGKEIERALAELSGEIVSDGLETYKSSVSAIQQFKDNLASVLKDIGNDYPVIVFVDELDRCRPQYAISLLERIKHLLSLPGIIFILGIDRTQLAHAIRGVYGEHFDSEAYLQRFIDLDYRLPRPNISDFASSLIREYKLDDFFVVRRSTQAFMHEESNALLESIAVAAALFELSLRDVEHILARVNIVVRSSQANQCIHPYLLISLLTLRAKEPDAYAAFKAPNGTSEKPIEIFFNRASKIPIESTEALGTMIAYLALAKVSNRPGDTRFVNLIAAQHRNDETLRSIASMATEKYNNFFMLNYMRNLPLRSVLDRIEMSHKFSFGS
jgi:hypothetical protein